MPVLKLSSRWTRFLSSVFLALLLSLALVMSGCGRGGANKAGEDGGPQEAAEMEGPAGGEQPAGEEAAGEGAAEGEAAEEEVPDENAEDAGFAFDTVNGGSEAVMILKDIRFGGHDGYERVVVEFTGQEGNPRGGTPRFRVSYMEPPYVDAEGNTVAIEGSHLIELHFCGNTADLSVPEGYKVVYEGPESFDPGLAVIRQARLVPAYELNGMILLIGLGERAPFRVEEELGPPRIVIDVKE